MTEFPEKASELATEILPKADTHATTSDTLDTPNTLETLPEGAELRPRPPRRGERHNINMGTFKRKKRNANRTHKVSNDTVNKDDTENDFVGEENILRKDIPRIEIDDLMEMLCAIHFSSYVAGPIEDAGGLMLVAPSGSLKSSLLMMIANLYPSKCICDSNWYYQKFTKMQASFYNRSIRSIVIPELASIYAGDPRTGGRMEQLIQQMAGEGSQSTNAKDSRFSRYVSRATIFAALTPEFADKKHDFWGEGFHRRFLWAYIAMENDDVLLDYLVEWKRAEIEMSKPIAEPTQGRIPDTLTNKQKNKLRDLLLEQKVFGPNHTRFVVFCKAVAVLQWHYKRFGIRKDAMETAKRFSKCLSNKAALLVIPTVNIKVKGKK